MKADRIVRARVLTFDPQSSVAEAIAIANGKVLAVGSWQDVLEFRHPGTAIDDFRDATVIPGFNDAHAHMDNPGMQTLLPSLAGARSIADIIERIRKLAAAAPKGSWIVTMPVGEPPLYIDPLSQIAERRMPTRQELDSVAPDHPVYIPAQNSFWSGVPCYSALNSLGLKLNGIDRDTRPRARSIEIQYGTDGEPNGVIVEKTFANLVEPDLLPAVPRFKYQDRLQAVQHAMKMYHAVGTTSIYEGHSSTPEILSCYRELHERGELTMRVSTVAAPVWTDIEEAKFVMRDWLSLSRGRGFGDAFLRQSGIFIGWGGDPAVPHLMMNKDSNFHRWTNMVRTYVNTLSEYEEMCMLAGEYNLRVHVMVDRNLREVLPIMERVAQKYPIGERRWVFEHVSNVNAEDVERIRRLGVAVTLIPSHMLWKIGHSFASMPDCDLDYLSPAKQLYEAGVPVSAGTDAFPHNPLFCAWSMVTRQDRKTGKIMGEGGRVGNETALRLLTVGGAWLSFEENLKGPLAPGYYADLAVLSADPIASAPEALLEIDCRGTMVGGQWVSGACAV